MKKIFLAAIVLLSAWILFVYFQGSRNSVKVVCQTTKGPLDIVVEPSWSPRGAERFLQMVDEGFYQNVPLFRCVDQFLCQFGATPPKANAKNYPAIADDPKLESRRNFKKGYLSFAGNGANSRTTQIFLTLGENVTTLGANPWETPFGFVSEESMRRTVSQWTTSYGEMPPWGQGPDPQKIQAADGAQYLKQNFPNLDYIQSCARQ